MLRICAAILLLAMVGLTTGCGQGGGAVYAGAPTASFPTSYTVTEGGKYTLFHVTQINEKGQPTESQQVAAYDLKPGDKLGFDWISAKADMYGPDAHSDLVAYAGPHRMNLGGIKSINERYYWADANGWSGYWGGQMGRNFGKALTLQ